MSVAKSERGGAVKRAASLPGPEARQVLLIGGEANSGGENSAAAILGLWLRCYAQGGCGLLLERNREVAGA